MLATTPKTTVKTVTSCALQARSGGWWTCSRCGFGRHRRLPLLPAPQTSLREPSPSKPAAGVLLTGKTFQEGLAQSRMGISTSTVRPHTQRKPPGKQGRGSGRHPGRCYLEGGEREEDGKDSGHSKGYMPGRANADGCRDSFRKSVTPDSGAEVADSPAHCHTPLQTRVTTRRERGSGPFQMACL